MSPSNATYKNSCNAVKYGSNRMTTSTTGSGKL